MFIRILVVGEVEDSTPFESPVAVVVVSISTSMILLCGKEQDCGMMVICLDK